MGCSAPWGRVLDRRHILALLPRSLWPGSGSARVACRARVVHAFRGTHSPPSPGPALWGLAEGHRSRGGPWQDTRVRVLLAGSTPQSPACCCLKQELLGIAGDGLPHSVDRPLLAAGRGAPGAILMMACGHQLRATEACGYTGPRRLPTWREVLLNGLLSQLTRRLSRPQEAPWTFPASLLTRPQQDSPALTPLPLHPIRVRGHMGLLTPHTTLPRTPSPLQLLCALAMLTWWFCKCSRLHPPGPLPSARSLLCPVNSCPSRRPGWRHALVPGTVPGMALAPEEKALVLS